MSSIVGRTALILMGVGVIAFFQLMTRVDDQTHEHFVRAFEQGFLAYRPIRRHRSLGLCIGYSIGGAFILYAIIP